VTGAPPAAAPPRPRRIKPPIRRNARNVLAFALLSLVPPAVVVGVLLVVYIVVPSIAVDHQASPTAAASGLLDAMLHRRDTSAVNKYLCDNQQLHQQVNTMIRKINAFNSRPGSAISYTWTVRLAAKNGDHATVAADLESELTVSGTPTAPTSTTWTLTMRNHLGWKVCALRAPK
jgi:hypothetical protein